MSGDTKEPVVTSEQKNADRFSKNKYHEPTRATLSAASEKSTCIVAPSPSGSVAQLKLGEEMPTVNSPRFDYLPSASVVPPHIVPVPPGAAAMLAKFKPFTEEASNQLKKRILDRKRHDENKRRDDDLDDTRIVDGKLVLEEDEQLVNDPRLLEGRSLPKIVAKHFPKHFIGTPIEDPDPRNREYNETFIVISRRFNKSGFIYRFSAAPSMYLFQPWHPLRRLALYSLTHPIFDIIVIFTILANSLSMAMNISESIPEYTFLAIYTVEATVKSVARGIILNKYTYLRDGWNWLDFIVLVSAYSTIIAQSMSTGATVNIQALRTFRVFRVLKTIAIIPGLKSIIEALMRALKMLGDVLIMTVFFYTIFALFGVQLFQGTLRSKCVKDVDFSRQVNMTNATELAEIDSLWQKWISDSENWGIGDNGEDYTICGNASGAQGCPVNHTCILVADSPNPNNDFTKFDDFLGSFLIAVQIFNTDFWDSLFHDVIAANGPAAFLFFVIALIFLNYYLANLVQAVVALSYTVEEDEEEEDDELHAVGKGLKRRFVFDPLRLRTIHRPGSPLSRSLLSVRHVTERRIDRKHSKSSKPHANDFDTETNAESVHTGVSGKPIAVVKPQLANGDTLADCSRPVSPKNGPMFDHPSYGYQPQLHYASRPPSIVSTSKLPHIGFWDRNPFCCLGCCSYSAYFAWLKFQSSLLVFVTDPFFELFITFTIVINTISMAAYYHGMPQEWIDALSAINDVCTYIFITEAVLKLTAMSKEYFTNRWNLLDFIVVIGSLVDIAMSYVNISSGGFNSSIIRLLRLLRILKLAQSWKTMRTLLEIILGTVGAIGNLMLVLLIVIFIFAIIGMQLFGGTYTDEVFLANPGFTDDVPGFEGIPEWNWDDFLHAFMLVFRVLCRETYQPMWDCISANSIAICLPFYLCTLIVGSYVVLNLFLAVLLNAFNSEDLKKMTKNEEDNRLKVRIDLIKRYMRKAAKSCWQKCCPTKTQHSASVAPAPVTTVTVTSETVLEGDTDRQTTTPDNDGDTVAGGGGRRVRLDIADGEDKSDTKARDDGREVASTATGKTKNDTTASLKSSNSPDETTMRDCCWPCLDRNLPGLMAPFRKESQLGFDLWRVRQVCFKICSHKAFEYTILGFIFASSFSLCLQDATLVEGSTMEIVLTYMDYVYLGVFTIELIIKLIAYGFRVYFTSSWTILDFLIVTTGFIDVGLSASSTGVNLSSLRALRTLRALRPLRAISRWQGMKIVVNALFTAIPGIINVFLVVMIIWLIFAIMGVQFFAGKFYMCVEIESGDRIPEPLAPSKQACVNNSDHWAWTTYPINFDNVANAYLALFQMGSFEGWTTVLQLSIDAPDQLDLQPAPELNVNYYVYYLIFIVLCSFFLLNLFVGVIIDDFNALKKRYEGGTAMMLFMTESQKKYYTTIKQLGHKKPKKAIVKPNNSFSKFMFNIADSPSFEYAIAAVIGLNVVAMATEHFNQNAVYTLSQDLLNIMFTTIFTLEAILKLIGYRQYYFHIPWNVFDFIIVVVSILGIALNDLFVSLNVSPSLLRLIRVLRVGRIVRLFRASKGVRKLLLSFFMSLPALFNIACLLFLIIFIYSIIGMNLFGHVGHSGGNINDVQNFHTFPYALLTLFRLTTIAGWDNIHQGLSFTDDPASGCNPHCSEPFCNPCCNRTYWTRPNGEIVLEEGSGGWGNCGQFQVATIYLVSYLLMTYFIIVNMFAAVILDNYQQATAQEDNGVTDDDIEAFYRVWEQFDPLATQFIKYDDLSHLAATLDPPLGIPKPNEHALILLDFPIMKDDSTGEEVIHCLDVLMGLVRRTLGFIEATDDFMQVKDNLETVFTAVFPSRTNVTVVSSTRQRKKQDIAVRLLQRNWRKYLTARGMRKQALERQKSDSATKKRLTWKATTATVHFTASAPPNGISKEE